MARTFTPPILAAFSLASGLAAAACASMSPSALSSDLAGTRWHVSAIVGDGPGQVRQARVEFAPEDRISGSGGCNRFFGVYEAAGGAIDVRALGRTEMACETPLMEQEEIILAVLDKAERYELQGDQLVITADDGRRLVLTRASG
jgi:heat shock protein HslJ